MRVSKLGNSCVTFSCEPSSVSIGFAKDSACLFWELLRNITGTEQQSVSHGLVSM
jgi:hypothetical protein